MKKILTLICLISTFSLIGQNNSKSSCTETVYSTCATKPTFGNSYAEFEEYFQNNVQPMNSQSQSKGIFTVKMNCKGEIFEVDFFKGNLKQDKQDEIVEALLKMPKWSSAELDGSIDYQFFLDFTFKNNQFNVKPFMR